MTAPQRAFRLQRLPKRPELPAELNEHIAEILAEGFCAYLLRQGLLKHHDTESLLAHIDELKQSRPNYETL